MAIKIYSPSNNIGHVLVIFAFLILFSVGCNTEAPTPENIQRAKELSLEGMKIVENWEGKSEDLRRAAQIFKEALSLNKGCPEAYTGLGRVALRSGLISGNKYEKRALDTALNYAEKAISLDGNYMRAHKLRGRVLALTGRYDESFSEAAIIEKIDSSSCEHIDLRVGIYEVRGDYNDAIAEVIKELSCQSVDNKERAGIYDSLADLYLRIKDYDNSILYYKKAIDLNPSSAWLYGNYSRALTAKGELDKAEEMVRKAISIMDYGMAHAYLSDIHAKRGELYLKQNAFDKAENEFLAAVHEDPDSKQAYNNLAYIFAKKGNYAKARQYAEEVLSIDTNDEYAKKMIAQCNHNNKKTN